MRLARIALFFLSVPVFSQGITSIQQKALNNYVDYANQATDEVTAVVQSIIVYYPTIHKKSSWGVPRYACPIQLEDYYLTTARAQSNVLGSTLSAALNGKLNALREASEKLDSKCKALDTYHKLEDYKNDNYAKAELMIQELQVLLVDYRLKQKALQQELETSHKKLTASAVQGAYQTADIRMREEIAREEAFLNSWSFNLNEETHTGWPVEALAQSILDTDAHLSEIQKMKPVLKYPASSMWSSFQESLGSVLTVKRSALDEYNFEAKKSDKHSNDVYLSLINYFNGTLVSDHNTFVQFSERDGYRGLKSVKFVPLFEIRTGLKEADVSAKRFKDIPRTPVTVVGQKAAIAKPVFMTLSNYVDFINETWRQTRYMQMVLSSFNSTASYYKNLENFDKRGAMSFDYKDFTLPLSQYQKTIADSKVLSPVIAKSLNDQAEVLLNILKEMDDLGATLEVETRERRYEKDKLKKVYEILERQKVLLDTWDERKELLYLDVRKVFDSYPVLEPSNSWYVSGKALQVLTDLDREGLFKAKSYYGGQSGVSISTEKIDETLRDVIAKEYDNMKGIQKYGRNNGLCPYTPYEDLPVASKALSEELKKLKPVSSSSAYRHPYHQMVYYYNDVVGDYNKFCELSTGVPQLKTVNQPELYTVMYPEPVKQKEQNVVVPVVALETTRPAEVKVAQEQKTVPAAQSTKILHDTVYIERRDTVYISEPGENLRSMEGYATNNLILLLDVSGSMNTPDKLPLLKESVMDLLSMMRQEDEVSIVAFSEKPKALLTAASFKEESKIRKAINDLKPSGKTDGNAAIKLAYKVADENYVRGGNNRIVLATDGEFALNDESRQLIERFSKEDIFLSVFNFGKGAGASKSLEKLAEAGKGNYQFISRENVELQLIHEVKAKKKQ